MRTTRVLGRGLGCRPLHVSLRPKAALRPRAAQQEEVEVESKGKASEEDKQAAQRSGKDIYIGFDKSDTSSRVGRKGRVITDDPERYPDRTTMSGGWAGGEIGLQEFVKEDAQEVKKAKVVETKDKGKGSEVRAVTGEGEEIYLGFGKNELDQRKAGGQGRFIRDDPRKYPNKENLGGLMGVTGGFAGGEKGVQQFAQSGEIRLDDQVAREFSPIVIAAVVAGGVTTGAILLNSGVILSEQAITNTLQSGTALAPGGGEAAGAGLTIDDNTKLLLNVAFALLGLGSLVIGARAVTKRLQESSVQLKEDAFNVAKIGVFWILVLLVALYVIDSQ